jgi:hypothetical protein
MFEVFWQFCGENLAVVERGRVKVSWWLRPLVPFAKLTARSHQSTKDGLPTFLHHPSSATTALCPRQLTDIMGFYKFTALALLALRAVSVFAADAVS